MPVDRELWRRRNAAKGEEGYNECRLILALTLSCLFVGWDILTKPAPTGAPPDPPRKESSSVAPLRDDSLAEQLEALKGDQPRHASSSASFPQCLTENEARGGALLIRRGVVSALGKNWAVGLRDSTPSDEAMATVQRCTRHPFAKIEAEEWDSADCVSTGADTTEKGAASVVVKHVIHAEYLNQLFHGILGPVGASNILAAQRLARDALAAEGHTDVHFSVVVASEKETFPTSPMMNFLYEELFGWRGGVAVRSSCVRGDWILAGVVPFQLYREGLLPLRVGKRPSTLAASSLVEVETKLQKGLHSSCVGRHEHGDNNESGRSVILHHHRSAAYAVYRWRGIREAILGPVLKTAERALSTGGGESPRVVNVANFGGRPACEQYYWLQRADVVVLGEGAGMISALLTPNHKPVTFVMVWDRRRLPHRDNDVFHVDFIMTLRRHRVIVLDVCDDATMSESEQQVLANELTAPFCIGFLYVTVGKGCTQPSQKERCDRRRALFSPYYMTGNTTGLCQWCRA